MPTATLAPSSASVATLVDAPIAAVWAIVSDPTRMAEHSPENVGADLDGPLAVGTVFTGHNERDGNAWSMPCEVVELVAPTAFAFHAGDDELGTTWRYALREVDGRTELTVGFDARRLRHPDWAAQLDGRHAQLADDVRVTIASIAAAAVRETAA